MAGEKFTPAPWVYRDMQERGTLGMAWVDADGFTHVAECHRIARTVNGIPCHAPDGMAEANARLIAAAPALYEALKELLETVELDWPKADFSRFSKAVDAARAALSQAQKE
jgi:hypothetical protein